MQHLSDSGASNRPLTEAELRLCRWMLEHGPTDAQSYLPQLELAEVTPWRCPCGCASINFHIQGAPIPATHGIKPIAEFVFGGPEDLSGIFLYIQQGDVLSGLEVYGLSGDAPRELPTPSKLSERSLRDLLAIHFRYGLPMRSLAQFETPANRAWFRSRDKYWYGAVFGKA